MNTCRHCGYPVGHPWYFMLGGPILTPRQILALVQARGYQGYRADEIKTAGELAEPARSQRLRAILAEVKADLRRDLARYRALACALRRERLEPLPAPLPASCSDLHTAISLKYAHVSNGLAHLSVITELLTVQGDLFDSA